MGHGIYLIQWDTIAAGRICPTTGLMVMNQYDGSLQCCPQNMNCSSESWGKKLQGLRCSRIQVGSYKLMSGELTLLLASSKRQLLQDSKVWKHWASGIQARFLSPGDDLARRQGSRKTDVLLNNFLETGTKQTVKGTAAYGGTKAWE